MGKEGECVTCGKEYVSLSQHYHESYPSHKPDHWPKCPSCGEQYNQLGQHWVRSDCDHPELSQYQYEVLEGLMMGDGYINIREGKNNRFRCEMITKEYLEWLDSVFGVFGTGVKLKRTAEESAKLNRDSGFSPNGEEENHNDSYYWQTRGLPQLEEFAAWYDTGSIVWPDYIELTPTVLKHWYVSDGYYNDKNGQNHLSIATSNELDNQDKLEAYFEEVGLPKPNYWSVSGGSYGGKGGNMVWNVDESLELWEYMLEDGHGIPDGFEYKFPEELH